MAKAEDREGEVWPRLRIVKEKFFNSLAEALLKVEGVTPRVAGWVGG